MSEWWTRLYDDLLLEVFLERDDPEEVPRTLAFLTKVLKLNPGARVFDQCCGAGNLAVPLAAQGYDVLGVDQAATYIERGRARGSTATLARGDAFDFVASPKCDAGFNWWTSFGYCQRDEDNLRMLQRAHDSLEPGARFALDMMNVAGALAHFSPKRTLRRETARGEVVLTRHTQLDLGLGVMHKRWVFEQGDEVVAERQSSVRLYLPHELGRLMNAARFDELEFYGGIDGSELTRDSARAIVVGVAR